MKATIIGSRTASAKLIRPLGALEQMFWLRAQVSTVHFLLAAEIEGTTLPEEWVAALDLVQKVHPMLSVGIRQDKDTTLCFEHRPGIPIPLRFVSGEYISRWEDELEAELATPFQNDDTPLLRAVLIHYPHRYVLILTAHHSISDGLSLSFIIRDLLAALSGRKLTSYPFPAAIDEGMGLTEPGLDKGRLNGPPLVDGRTAPSRLWASTQKTPRVHTHRLSPEVTSRLIERAREEATTFHGALIAALLMAGRRVFPKWREKTVRVLSPISVRKTLGIGEDCRLCLSSKLIAFLPVDNRSFWELARYIRKAIGEAGRAETVKQDTMGLRQFVEGRDIAGADLVSEKFNREFVVSNIGHIGYDTCFGHVRLVSMWGPTVHSGFEDEYSVAVCTVNESCCLTITSRLPYGQLLLDAAVEELTGIGG